jgi:hypothetical protein
MEHRTGECSYIDERLACPLPFKDLCMVVQCNTSDSGAGLSTMPRGVRSEAENKVAVSLKMVRSITADELEDRW